MQKDRSLEGHIQKVLEKERRFENVFQSLTRMFRSQGVEKTTAIGKEVFDYNIFRQGDKTLVGMYHELNSFVNFVHSAAEGQGSREQAFVLIGEPGNGKTFFVDFVQETYRNFLSLPENQRFTFEFKNLKELGGYGNIPKIQSQTYEDPMVLAMNLFGFTPNDRERSKEWLASKGFDPNQVDSFFSDYRPLGACTDYILNEIREYADGDLSKMLEFVDVVPVRLSPTQGTVTSKLDAKDKITSSAEQLVGKEDVKRMLQLSDSNHPYMYNLRAGALARAGGGGIHFADELFKFKEDLILVYLGLIQDRKIDVSGFKWPLDTLIIATSNNTEFLRYSENGENSPVIDRCHPVNMPHNTDVKLQQQLTNYAIGTGKKTTFIGDERHTDPNLNSAASTAVVLTRLPKSDKLSPEEMLKLASGDIAGEKSLGTLRELYNDLQRNPDVSKRFGQQGIGQRGLIRALAHQAEKAKTQTGACMFAFDIFDSLEEVVVNEVRNNADRKKYLDDIKYAKKLYKRDIKVSVFNAYMDDGDAIKSGVMNYVNMVIALGRDDLSASQTYTFKDPQTGKLTSIKVDKKYVKSIESRMGLETKEQQEAFRNEIRGIYSRELHKKDPTFDFMNQDLLVTAVTDVRLQSDINSSGSLVGALANRTKKENQELYSRLLDTMTDKLGFCNTCATKTLEYYCSKMDES